MSTYTHKMEEHFNIYWDYFDESDDQCVDLPEFKKRIIRTYVLDISEVTSYWINYYWTMFKITETWWWKYKLSDGGFRWEDFRRRVPDGPAFDGAEFVYQSGESTVDHAFMWFMEDQCRFSLGTFGNTDPNMSGDCTIPGHETIGYAGNVTDIIWNFASSPEHEHKMLNKVGEWGPTVVTDHRYHEETNDMWLWEINRDHFCEYCDTEGEGLHYPEGEDFWGNATKYA